MALSSHTAKQDLEKLTLCLVALGSMEFLKRVWYDSSMGSACFTYAIRTLLANPLNIHSVLILDKKDAAIQELFLRSSTSAFVSWRRSSAMPNLVKVLK